MEDSKSRKRAELRQKAEAKLEKTVGALKELPAEKKKDIQSLLHELQVHAIELELQNDELMNKQNELQALEEQFKHLFDFAPVGYLILDEEGVILQANLTICEQLGIDRSKILNEKIYSFIYDDHKDFLFRSLRKLFQEGDIENFEIDIVDKRGSQKSVLIDITLIENKDGSKPECRIALSDNSKLKEIEIEKEKLGDKFKIITELSSDYSYEYKIKESGEFELVWVSGAFQEITGYAKSESEERGGWSKLIYPDDADILQARSKNLFDGNEDESKFRIVTNDGAIKWVKDFAKPIMENGKPVGIIGCATDITSEKEWSNEIQDNYAANLNLIEDLTDEIEERKKVEKELIESEEKYRGIIENTLTGILVADDKGNYLTVNQAAADMLGYSIDELVKMSVADLQTKSQPGAVERYKKYLNTGKETGEFDFIRKDGEERIAKYHAVRIKPDFNISLMNDITEEKKVQIALMESEAELHRNYNDLKLAQKIASIGNWILDPEVGVPEWSDLIYEIYERDPDKGPIPVKDYKNLYTGKDYETFTKAITDASQYGKPYDIELQPDLPSGKKKWIKAICEPEKIPGKSTYLLRGTIQDITERKKNEITQKRIKEFLAQTGEIAKVGGWEVNMETGDNYWTDITRKIHEVSDDFVPTLDNAIGFYTPESKEIVEKAVDNSIKKGEEFDVELELLTAKGNKIWTRSIGKSEFKNGKCVRLYGAFQDITEQKKAEAETNINLTKYKTLFESMPAGITVSDASGNIIESNLEAEQLLGLSKEEQKKRTVSGKEWKIIRTDGSLMPPEEFPSTRALKENKTISNVEMGIVKGKGDITWITVTAAPIPLENYGVVITYFDITDRINADKLLEESEEKFRHIFENVQVGVYRTRISDGKLILANQRMAELFGYNTIQGALRYYVTSDHYVNENSRKEMLELLQKNKRFDNYEAALTTRKGEVRWFRYSGRLFEEGGFIEGVATDITDQKKYETELKERNDFIQTVLDNLPIGVALNYIYEGNAFYQNKMFERVYGWPSDEMKDITRFFKKVYPDKKYRDELIKRVMADIKSGDTAKMHWEDCVITHKDGSKHIVDAQNIPLFDQNTMVSTVIDVTERKEAENQLRESQQRYATLVESAHDAITIHINGRIAFINQAGVELLEAKNAEQLIGTDISNIVHPDIVDEVNDRVSKILRGKEKYYTLEEKYITLKGNEIDVEVTANPVIFNEQKAVQAIVRDVTERKRAQEQIIKERNRAERYLESAAIMMLVLDSKGKVTMINSKGAEILGYSKKYIIGKNWFDNFIPEENRKELKRVFKKAASGELVSAEHNVNPILCRYKKTKMVSWRNNFIKDENGQVKEVISSGEDITDSIKMKNELENSNAKLSDLTKHMDKVREEERLHLAREIHDDLGQSLTALKLDLTAAKNISGDKEQVNEIISDAIVLTSDTIKSVQQMTSELRPTMIDDLGLIPTIEWYAKQFSERAKLRYHAKIDVNEDEIAQSNKIIIYRIIQESLTNIARHAKASKFGISYVKKDKINILTIDDDGIGIDDDAATRFNSHGLIGMQERARAIGAELEIRRRKTKGTRVRLSIPLSNK